MTTKAEKNEKRFREFMDFILDNRDDMRTMDALSTAIFPYTSKYQDRYGSFTRSRRDDHDDLTVVT